MGFLNRLLHRYKYEGSTLQDILSVDLESIPDNTFRLDYRLGSKGQGDLMYIKKLSNHELNLFNRIEVKTEEYDLSSKTISFSNDDVSSLNIQSIEKLVNQCYTIYGYDSSIEPKGIFDDRDRFAIARMYWTGRMWTGKEHNPAVLLLLNETKIELVIWYKSKSSMR